MPRSRRSLNSKATKPGWLFKLGAQGLGYYRDRGGLVVEVSIAQAIQPPTSLPAAPLALDKLIARPTTMPKMQLIASRVVFTPAGLAATCAALLAANAPPAQ